MAESKIACPYCKELIEPTAVKCKHCLEFLPNFAKDKTAKAKIPSEQIIVSIIELIGKSLIPIVVLIIALVFKPTLEYLLIKAQTAEFLGTKISFSETKSYSGDLKPVELYFLLQSAQNYGHEIRSTLNYDSIKRKGQENIIRSLADKGLIKYSVSENIEKDQTVFGKEKLIITPTEKGKYFLIELGLSFDGKIFTDPP